MSDPDEVTSRLYQGLPDAKVQYVEVHPPWFEKTIIVVSLLMVLVMIYTVVTLSTLGNGNRKYILQNQTILCYDLLKHGIALPAECTD